MRKRSESGKGNPSRVIRRRWLFALALFLSACSSSTTPSSSTPAPPPPGTYYYQLKTTNIRLLDTSSGRYVMWLKFVGDSSYTKSVPLLFWTINRDSIIFQGTAALAHASDSVVYAGLSIEPTVMSSSQPSSIVMAGPAHGSVDTMGASNGIGDYSNAQASILFTTKSSDTSRAISEFYLMKFSNGQVVTSTLNFPSPPSGWAYGLWVLDSNYYPQHRFFYGSFTDPNGFDSDSSRDAYPFPGGTKSAPLNDPGGRVEITLEPTYSVVGNHPSAPSPFTVMWTPLQRFPYFNESLPLQNVWKTSAPSGYLKLWR